MTGFLFDVFIVKIVEFVGAAMLLISLWPDAVVNTIMHAKNLFSSATVISDVSL